MEHGAAENEPALVGWGALGGTSEQQSTTADTLLVYAVAAVLAAIADRHVLHLTIDRLRHRPAAAARAARLYCAHGPAHRRFRSTAAEAVMVLRGDLELTPAQGTPQPEGGIIQRVTLDPETKLGAS